MILSLLFFRHDRVTYAVQFLAMAVAGGLGLHLFTEFPRPVTWLARGRASILFYLPAIFLPPLAFSIVFDPPEPWPRVAALANSVLTWWVLAAAVGILAIVVVQYARSRGTMLQQYRWLIAAALSGLVLPATRLPSTPPRRASSEATVRQGTAPSEIHRSMSAISPAESGVTGGMR